MSVLSKMRLKTKPNINLFLAGLRDLCTVHPENLATMMKQTIFNELSNARNVLQDIMSYGTLLDLIPPPAHIEKLTGFVLII